MAVTAAGQHQRTQETLKQSPRELAMRRGELMTAGVGPVQRRAQRLFDPRDATVDRLADHRDRILSLLTCGGQQTPTGPCRIDRGVGDGEEVLRTPANGFDNLPDWTFAPHYAVIRSASEQRPKTGASPTKSPRLYFGERTPTNPPNTKVTPSFEFVTYVLAVRGTAPCGRRGT